MSLRNFWDYAREYFLTSSVHGVGHLARSPWLEKVLWSILLWMCLFSALYLSNVSINRYNSNPIVISLERNKFAWTTLLPAITICPRNGINDTALEGYLEAAGPVNKTHLKAFLVSLVQANYSNLDALPDNEDVAPEDYWQVILQLQSRVQPELTFNGQVLDTREWFTEIITEMGICYCFNSQLAPYSSAKYWLYGSWANTTTPKPLEVHPLDVEVFANIVNLTSDCSIYVHGPYEVSDLQAKPIFLENGHFLRLDVKALSIISSPDARSLRINQRRCRYHYESNLEHFPVYSYLLCRSECRIKLAVKSCGCVPHFYRKLSHETTCGVAGLRCLSKLKERLITLNGECNCLSNCEEVNYMVDSIDKRYWFLGTNFQFGIKNFPEMRLKRDVIFRFSDLLVYIGGVLGFFQGISVLTVIEFFYYFTLRLFWFVARKGK